MDINSFRKAGIDLSPLGFDMNGGFENYYCTPDGAEILASSGVDGIHYCTVPRFGEMIFAVSPMNFGDCVHPIARDFEDLLRLLLHCGDIAALEQCYAWDEEQYKAFLSDYPPTEAQQNVLEEIRNRFCLEPIEDSFSYVKGLQAEFDLSLVPYTEDYYDPDMNPSAPEVSSEWAVYFDRGYYNKNSEGEAGEEVVIDKAFLWGDDIWHIPSIYSCEEGLVIDFCVEIAPEKEKAFMDKWYPVLSDGHSISNEIYEQIEHENPMNKDFGFELKLNGQQIIGTHGTSVSSIPADCLPDGVKSEREVADIIRHYGLDETRAWVFHRWSCPWVNGRVKEINSLKLKLECRPTAIEGIRFRNPSVGDEITFVHPIHNTEHKLTVTGYEKQEFPTEGFPHAEYEFPTCHTAISYTLEPDLADSNFRVRDCLNNEQPRLRPKNGFEPQSDYDACSMGIIGGADGPTAVMISVGESAQQHMAVSSLRFEYADDTEWKTVFFEKLIEDTEVNLI
ncbi:MAG: hypothetical protein IKB88_06085 [Clostridia bacterium]|nr:hypothetical protein [Clostridia bacterium]